MATREQVEAAIQIVQILRDTIQELGSVPNGVLYAHVSSYMTLQSYNTCIDVLVQAGVVTKSNNLLTWKGGN